MTKETHLKEKDWADDVAAAVQPGYDASTLRELADDNSSIRDKYHDFQVQRARDLRAAYNAGYAAAKLYMKFIDIILKSNIK